MDFQELLEKYSPLVKSNLVPLGVGIIGLILLVSGIIASTAYKPEEEIIFQSSEDNNKNEKKEIVVDISGAVSSPGVYALEEGSRIKDILILASGLSAEADRDWISKNLNLAQKLSDGSKIYIPAKGEASLSKTSNVGLVSSEGLININSASSAELESLSGIGPVTASKIIENRPYQAVEDLLNKKILGSKVFEKIKDKISVY